MKKTMKRLWLAAVLTLCAGATASAYDLTVAESGHGTVAFSVGGTAVTAAGAGQVVTVTVTPDEGYLVESVTARAYTAWAAAESRRRAPGMLADVALAGSGQHRTFTMPEAHVEVSAAYRPARPQYEVEAEESESGRDVEGVTLTMTVGDDGGAATATIDRIAVPDRLAGKPLTIRIPATVAGHAVTAVATGAVAAGSNVTDVYLPDTERPLAIEAEALPATATIHAPLALLDDYALMPSLRANYEAVEVMATVTPRNTCWTLSCGVDVVLPEGLQPYIVYTDGEAIRRMPLGGDQQELAGGRRGVRANNGVLLVGEAGRSFDLMASPGRQQSGLVPATGDARSYAGNQLEPVIEGRNYPADEYLVLKDNRFHSIKANDSKVKPCRAVLRIK